MRALCKTILLLCAAGCSVAVEPADEELIAAFRERRHALDELVSFLKENAAEFGCGARDERGASDEMKRRSEQLHAGAGVRSEMCDEEVTSAGGQLFYVFNRGGALPQGNELKGYAFLPQPPAHVIDTLDRPPPSPIRGALYYRHIDGPWYLFHYGN